MPIAMSTASPCTSGTGTSDGAAPIAINACPAARDDRFQPNTARSADEPGHDQRLLTDQHQPDRERGPQPVA